jgi:hypothetical protein
MWPEHLNRKFCEKKRTHEIYVGSNSVLKVEEGRDTGKVAKEQQPAQAFPANLDLGASPLDVNSLGTQP